MPVIHFEVGKLTVEQKREVTKEFTKSASKVTGIPEENFIVFIKENDAENVSVGGTLLSDKGK